MANKIVDVKSFIQGGLDLDSSPALVAKNDWIDALNMYSSSKAEGEDGQLTNALGNTIVNFTQQSGTNTVIGVCKDEANGYLYYFVHNSNNYHAIRRYDVNTNTVSTVLENLTQTGGINVLKFSTSYRILHANIIDGLLYWTDGLNEPRKLNVNKSYGVVTEGLISAAKPQPLVPIVAEYVDDPTFKQNRLKKNLFKFKYLFVYEDGERSAWSTYSKVSLPDGEINPDTDTSVTKNNCITLTLDCGDSTVKTIEIGAEASGTPYLVKTINKSDIVADVNNQVTVNFYNNELNTPIDVAEWDLAFDAVPKKAECQEVVNGNILVYGNITEGYDNIETNVQLTVSYENGAITESAGTPNLTYVRESLHGGMDIEYTLKVTGTPVAGDTYYIESLNADGTPGTDYSYTVVTGNTNTDIAAGLIASVTGNGGSGVALNTTTEEFKVTLPAQSTLDVLRINRVGSGEVALSENRLKLGSKYLVGMVYYDQFGRHGGVQLIGEATTDTFGAKSGSTPVIGYAISHTPPSWATRYQMVITANQTHQNTLYWRVPAPTVETIDNIDYYKVDLTTLSTFNTVNQSSVLSYDYTAGDRVAIHMNGSSYVTGDDTEVVSYNPETFILKFRKRGDVAAYASPLLIEIYTPKASSASTDSVYYEIGESFAITGGYHTNSTTQTASTPAQGFIRTGDAYYKVRSVPTINISPYDVTSIRVEDFNYSDFYASKIWSGGRGNVYSANNKELDLYDSFRFSQTYIPNSNVNGLSRFYPSNIAGSDIGVLRSHGEVKKISLRGNLLLVFQQLKTAVIPISQNIYEDQSGNQNVVVSQRLLNQLRYLNGNYGIGNNPESHCSTPTSDFFADRINGVFCEVQNNFIRPISKVKIDSWAIANFYSFDSIVSSYDPKNEMVYFTTNGKTIGYNVRANRWIGFYSFVPEFGAFAGNRYFTFKSGAIWMHNVNTTHANFYGTQYDSKVKLSFNVNPNLTKQFQELNIRSNRVLSTSTSGITTSEGQVSELIAADFANATLSDGTVVYNQGQYRAFFLRDKNMDLFSGDRLIGNYMTIELVYTGSSDVELLTASVSSVPSYT